VSNRISIVAEAAQGYEGDARQARLLARAAAKGAADLVKFQLVYADELALPSYRWFELFRQLEMPMKAWEGVREEAAAHGIGLAFDVFGMRSLDEALALGARVVKVHATDFFHDALVDAALRRAPEVHLSLGGISTEELDEFLSRHRGAGMEKLVLLLGYQAEPTPIGDNHLARVAAMRARFPELRVGWMDHADGAADEAEWLGVLAVPYGVTVLEKHITLSRPLGLEDDVSALDAEGFRRYVGRVRVAEQAIGSGALTRTDAELSYRRRALKVVVTTRAVSAGAEIPVSSLALRRTALDDGRTPSERLDRVAGRRAVRDIGAGSAVYESDLQ
jgi:sialic acid synthase SpsE